jgi:hypothetical protein
MWKVGDRVQKATGYKWPGLVVSVFETLDGKTRVVVECTVREVAGALHIYSPEQLVAVDVDDLSTEKTLKVGRLDPHGEAP